MANYFIGGSAVVEMFDGDTLFATAKTMLNNSISIDVAKEEVRGGEANPLRGQYFHDSNFSLQFEDSMFKMDYIAKNIGSAIVVGGDALVTEEVTLGAGGTGTVSETPVAFGDEGIIGWAYLKGSDTPQTVTFTGSNFTFSGGSENDDVCIKYMYFNSSADKLVVTSNIIPDTVRVIMKANLFAGQAGSTSKVGTVQIDVPRFQFNGTSEISLTSDGVSTTPLEGMALSVDEVSCEESGYFAVITRIINGANWYDDVIGMSIVGGDFDMTHPETATLDIRAIVPNRAPFKPPYADLTFVSGTVGTATIDGAGVVTTVAAGDTLITVTITSKTDIDASATITVS